MTSVHDTLRRAVGDVQDRLVGLSHALHAEPELGYQEVASARRIADELERAGMDVTRGLGELDTAFVGVAGSGELVVTICAEYDALPGVGHACGHNVIAATAVGAGAALASVADELGITVRVLGTPAEEGGGGKVYLLENGDFDGTNVAMMVHPAPHDLLGIDALASAEWRVGYEGKSAHAAAYPEQGRNAADALTVAQVGIGLLRQHLHDGDRIHGIVTDGGDAPNVIPERTGGRWITRSEDLQALARLQDRVRATFEAGALATGTQLTLTPTGPAYAEFVRDDELENLWSGHLDAVGRAVADLGPAGERMRGSTDMANVSLGMPTIHPMIAVDANGASNHQPEFAAACATPSADKAVHDGALLMAWVAADAALGDDLRARLLSKAFDAERDLDHHTDVPLATAQAVHRV